MTSIVLYSNGERIMLAPGNNNFGVLLLVEILAVVAQVKAAEQVKYPPSLFAARRAWFCAAVARYANATNRRKQTART